MKHKVCLNPFWRGPINNIKAFFFAYYYCFGWVIHHLPMCLSTLFCHLFFSGGARGRERESPTQALPRHTQPGARKTPHLYWWFSKAPLLVPTSHLSVYWMNTSSNWNLVFVFQQMEWSYQWNLVFSSTNGVYHTTPLLTSKFNIILIWSVPMEKWWGVKGP